jgi:glycosyltransferase involved in cell wall biosynthesis
MCYLWWPHARIAVSKDLTDYYNKKNREKIFYIPVGIDFTDHSADGKKIEDFGLKEQDYVLFIGRLIPTKKVDLLIKAYKNINTEKRLVIVGDAPYTSDSYCYDLKKNASDGIRFLGFQYGTTLLNLYKNCAFFVLPSENEGLPVALLEALSCGCKVLASDIPANTEALHGYGTTFRNGSLFDLCRKMTQLLNNPRSALNSSISAIQYVRSNYNWDAIVTSHEKLYNLLVRR